MSDEMKRCDHGKLCSEACEVCDTLVSSVAIEALIAERDLLRRQVSEKERQVDVLISGMCDALLGRRSCRRCACKTGTDEECKSGLREWSLEQAKATAKEGG